MPQTVRYCVPELCPAVEMRILRRGRCRLHLRTPDAGVLAIIEAVALISPGVLLILRQEFIEISQLFLIGLVEAKINMLCLGLKDRAIDVAIVLIGAMAVDENG